MTTHADAPATVVTSAAPVDRIVGWYRDPDDARRHRYWDGFRWLAQPEVFLPVPREPEGHPAA